MNQTEKQILDEMERIYLLHARHKLVIEIIGDKKQITSHEIEWTSNEARSLYESLGEMLSAQRARALENVYCNPLTTPKTGL